MNVDERIADAIADGTERRRGERRTAGIVATVTPLDGESRAHAMEVFVVDVSDHGAGLRSPASLDRRVRYRLRLGGARVVGDDPGHVFAIRWIRHRTDGQWAIGVEYDLDSAVPTAADAEAPIR